MKELSSWLKANTIVLNVAETEVILFKTKHKACNSELRFKFCTKIHNKTNLVRYLGIKIYKNLNWTHVHGLTSKLNRANLVLSNLRHFSVVKSYYVFTLLYFNLIQIMFV